MLEPATAPKVHDERVVVVRQLAEDLVTLFDDLRGIFSHFAKVVIPFAGYDVAMSFAANVERDFFKVADLERSVVEDVVVCRAKCIWLACDGGQSGRDAPLAIRNDSY